MESIVVFYVVTKSRKDNNIQATKVEEIIELSWAILDVSDPQVLVEQSNILIDCDYNAEKLNQVHKDSDTLYEIVTNLKEAIHQFDTQLYNSLISNNKEFCLLTDGPFHLQHLSQAAYLENVSLGVHYAKYFDIRIEFGKRFTLAPQPSSLKDILQYLDMNINIDYLETAKNGCYVLIKIVKKLLQEGHKFSMPEQNVQLINDSNLSSDSQSTQNNYNYNNNNNNNKNNNINNTAITSLNTSSNISEDLSHSNRDQFTDSDSPNTVLRLRGLPWQTTEQDIVEFFDRVNIVPDGVFIPLNRQGRPTGEAYVEFETELDMNEALKRDRDRMGRRYIELFHSSKTTMEQSRRMVEAHFGGDDGLIVRMRGLPFSATARDIVDFFSGLSIAPGGVHLVFTQEGRATGEAFVEFTTPETARQAMKLHREMMGRRYIELFRSSRAELRISQSSHAQYPSSLSSASSSSSHQYYSPHPHHFHTPTPVSPIPHHNHPHHPQPYPSNGYSNIPIHHLEYGMSSNTLENEFESSPSPIDNSGTAFSEYVVRLRGLPFSAKEIEIADFFSGINIAPQGIHLVFNHHDKPTGEAFVELISQEDVSLAMGKHKQMMGTRYIEVFNSSREEMALACQGEYPPVINSVPTYSPMMPVAGPWETAPAYWETGYTYPPEIRGGGSGSSPAPVGGGYHYQHPVRKKERFEPGSTLKLRGLPFSSTKREISHFFYGYDFDPSSIRLGKNRRGKPSGEAWVRFTSPAEARRAQADRDRCHIGPRYIELFIE